MERCEKDYCGRKDFQTRSKKMRDLLKKECIRGYCNPGCKNTVFQAGKSIPEAVFRNVDVKTRRFVRGVANMVRKGLFGKKTNVLKNSFYTKLPAKNVTRARKQGALSGCSVKILT